MFFYLILLFTVVPLVELGLLIWIGTRTSVSFTLGLVIATGILGASLARWQGWRAATRIQTEWARQQIPADPLFDALLIFVAGLLLITPGILTDAVGFLLLIPPVRHGIKRRIAASFKSHIRVQTEHFHAAFGNRSPFEENPPDPASPRSQIIDAKVISTRVEDDPDSD